MGSCVLDVQLYTLNSFVGLVATDAPAAIMQLTTKSQGIKSETKSPSP